MQTDLLHLQRYHESGDATAFQSLVRHHASMVFATARRITRDASLAEDVAQETFLELASKGRTITESVGAWLHSVAWRRACDVVRAESTRQRHEAAASAISEGRECTWEELEPVFDEALAELPSDERTVIIEHYLEGSTQTEIAKRLGISQSSVSRLLEQSLDHLRARLKSKGVLCGAALGSMMIAASSEAASAALLASLQKIALSSIGGGAAAATGGTLWAALLGLNLKAVTLTALLVAACAAGFDLASKESLITRWLTGPSTGAKPSSPAPVAQHRTAVADAIIVDRQRLLAQARAIWARRPKSSKAELHKLFSSLLFEKDAEKRYAGLQAAGVTLSRAEYDRVLARYPNVRLLDERKSFKANNKLFFDLMVSWYAESPLEGVALDLIFNSDETNLCFPSNIAPWVRSHPDEWAAFVEVGPDPRLGDYARLWVEDLDDPGSIWSKAKEAGLNLTNIETCIARPIYAGMSSETLFKQVLRCPGGRFRDEHMIGLAPKLTAEQLQLAADSGGFTDASLANVLRALAGDARAVFRDASTWITEAANGGGEKAVLANWSTECASLFYAQWLKADPQAALQHSVRSNNQEFLDRFMREAAASPAINEAMIVSSFSSVKNRDHALAAYYQAKSGGDPQTTLHAIMGSPFVEDQIEAAKQILEQWTTQSTHAAAQWVAGLPANEDNAELSAVVVSKWAEMEPEAAFAFAQQQGIRLEDGWINGLAWGGRVLPEDKLTTIFASLRSDPEYNTLLMRLTGYRLPSQPEKAFAFLNKHGNPGWQTAAIHDINDWLQGDDSRAAGYTLQLLSANISQVDPALINQTAQLFLQHQAKEGKLTVALDWTLKLSASIAAQARAEGLSKVDLNDAKQRAATEQWIRRAAISESERASLSQQVSDRAQLSAGTR